MYLISGSTGFIGTNLLDAIGERCRLIVRNNHKKILNDYEYFNISDFSSSTNWDGAFTDITCIIHLASIAHDNLSKISGNLSYLFEVNTEGTLNLALSAAKNGVKRFIFISSIGVNGNSSNSPFNESDIPMPSEPYAVSKLRAEEGLIDISKKYEMEVVIIRPPLVYGLNAPGNFSKLLKFVMLGFPLPISRIDNKRSFIGVSNLVDFIILCINHSNASNQLFLVSDGEDISTPEFLKIISYSLGINILLLPFPIFILRAIAYVFNRQSDFLKFSSNLQINISKAKDLLGWQPKYSIQHELSNLR